MAFGEHRCCGATATFASDPRRFHLELAGISEIIARMPRLLLYPFRFRDPVSGKWKRARHVAERHEITAPHAEWEIVGAPEIRDVDPNARHFHAYRVMQHAELKRLQERPLQINPHLEQPPPIEAGERFLVALFLRRYVTYRARRRRFAQMQGAARLSIVLSMLDRPQ
jgi:hypothetical protein